MSEITCTKCEKRSCTFDNFQDLSVSFPKAIRSLMDSNFELSKLLENFSKEEIIEDFLCKNCKTRVKARRKLEIWRVPKILVIHLKRFLFGTYRREKLSHNVIFPEKLDLGPFVKNTGKRIKALQSSA
jgi:ubiquitin C-terminal hydrolase